VAARVRRGVLVGADTVVVLGTQVFGKPRSRREAYRMLRALQGRTHSVYTGVALRDCATQRWRTAHVHTRVTMRPLTTHEMTRYFALVNPLDKAGAYAIQEAGGIVIERINGCYYNVLGFPVAMVETLLRTLGYSLLVTARTGHAR
jgi:septum formation protein